MPATKAKPATVPAASSARFIDLADNCFRDNDRLYRGEDGQLYFNEYTPTIGDERVSFKQAAKLAADCQLAGGSWRLPDPHELQALVDYNICDPALPPALKDRIQNAWHWTGKVDASSPSVYAWLVYFAYGYVYWSYQGNSGFVVACRRVPAGQ